MLKRKKIEEVAKATKEEMEKVRGKIEELEGKMEEILKRLEETKALKRASQEIAEKLKKLEELLKNLTEKEEQKKGIAIVLDWRNLLMTAKAAQLDLPLKRILDEAISSFEKPIIAALAFCEDPISPSTRIRLESSGFSIISCSDADSAIIGWLQNQGFPNALVDTILLFTNDEKLTFKAEIVHTQHPQKKLIPIRLFQNVLKNGEGKYILKLYPRPRKEALLPTENRFVRIVEAINQNRLFQPDKDPLERFFLFIVYCLAKIPPGFEPSFENLLEIVFETYIYPNPRIFQDPYLSDLARDKENIREVLEALLTHTDFLQQRRSINRIFYIINRDSQFFKSLRGYFPVLREYFPLMERFS